MLQPDSHRPPVKPGKPPSMLPQAIVYAMLGGPIFLLLECNSADRHEPSGALAKSFQTEIETVVEAAHGSKVRLDCSMHGNVNFAVSCRGPAYAAYNLQAHLLASGWVDAGNDNIPGNSVLRKGTRRITIEPMPGSREVSISMRVVTGR